MVAAPAFGGEVIYQATSAWVSQPPASSATVTVQLPQFDHALGHLTSVVVFCSSQIRGTMGFENTDFVPFTTQGHVHMYPTAPLEASLLAPGGYAGGANSNHSSNEDGLGLPPLSLSTFDGNIDFAGSSGVSVPFGPFSIAWNSGDIHMPYAYDLLTGSGTIQASATCGFPWLGSVSGAPAVYGALNLEVRASIGIIYTYADYPNEFCQHNGYIGNDCPCDPTDPPYVYESGSACPNSQEPDGARLAFSGQSSIASDNFVLTALGLPASAIGMYFQGTNAAYLGSQFGDGLRCVSGQIVRLGINTAFLGESSYPASGDPPISVKGLILSAGQFRAYQLWYRDPAPFCTAATFNLTSAVATVWTP